MAWNESKPIAFPQWKTALSGAGLPATQRAVLERLNAKLELLNCESNAPAPCAEVSWSCASWPDRQLDGAGELALVGVEREEPGRLEQPR